MTIRPSRPSSLNPIQKAALRAHKRQVRDCQRRLDTQGAVQAQTLVLSLTTQQWGTHHLKTLAALYDLGSCHLKNHQPDSALVHYKTAFEIASRHHPEMTAVLREVRTQIIICEILADELGRGSIDANTLSD